MPTTPVYPTVARRRFLYDMRMISASGTPSAISRATFREFPEPVNQTIVVDAIIIPYAENYLPDDQRSGHTCAGCANPAFTMFFDCTEFMQCK